MVHFLRLYVLTFFSVVLPFHSIINNYSLEWRWLIVNIFLSTSQLNKILSLSPIVRFCLFLCLDMNSIWLTLFTNTRFKTKTSLVSHIKLSQFSQTISCDQFYPPFVMTKVLHQRLWPDLWRVLQVFPFCFCLLHLAEMKIRKKKQLLQLTEKLRGLNLFNPQIWDYILLTNDCVFLCKLPSRILS